MPPDKAFIALIQRSDDAGDGWRKVNAKLRKLIELRVGETPGLYEVKDDEDGLCIRLSPDGSTVARYL